MAGGPKNFLKQGPPGNLPVSRRASPPLQTVTHIRSYIFVLRGIMVLHKQLNFDILLWELLIFLKYIRQVTIYARKRLLVELHIKQIVIIFSYLFIVTPLSNVLLEAFWNLTPADIQW